MIHTQLSTESGLLKIARGTILDFCSKHNLPIVPVYLKEIVGADGGFDTDFIRIYLSPSIVPRYKRYTPERALMEYSRVIRHELQHYMDKCKGIKLNRIESERKADRISIIDSAKTMSKYNEEEINPKHIKSINSVLDLYTDFHGNPPVKKVKVYYEAPEGEEIIKIGRLVRIDYTPEANSKYEGTHFTHEAGDLGHKTIRSNAILATNKSGTQLYIVKEKKSKYPKFSERGILG